MLAKNDIRKYPLVAASSCIHLAIGLLIIFFSTEKNIVLLKTKDEKIEEKNNPLAQMAALYPRMSALQTPVHFLTEDLSEAVPIVAEKEPKVASLQEKALDISKNNNTSIDQEKIAPAHDTSHLEKPSIASAPCVKRIRTAKSTHMRKKTSCTRKITFADIAQGFLESLSHQGNDSFRFLGDDTKKPNHEDLKYTSYLQKIVWYLQNSFKHNNHMPKIEKHFIVGLVLTIGKDGNITGLKIVESSGIVQLDEALMISVHNAAPFPPLPEHFKQSTFTIPFYVTSIMRNNIWSMNIHK